MPSLPGVKQRTVIVLREIIDTMPLVDIPKQWSTIACIPPPLVFLSN